MKLLNFPESVYRSYELGWRAVDQICGEILKIRGEILRRNFGKQRRNFETEWIGDDLI